MCGWRVLEKPVKLAELSEAEFPILEEAAV